MAVAGCREDCHVGCSAAAHIVEGEGVANPVDLHVSVAAGQRQHIESTRRLCHCRVVHQPRAGGAGDAPTLAPIHRGGGTAEAIAASLPYFDKHHRRAIAHDQIDLAESKRRSEEHTSELQSLMRISYAVFCLKKQTQTKKQKK